MKYPCENCKLRAQYDKNPKSLIGRFWQWQMFIFAYLATSLCMSSCKSTIYDYSALSNKGQEVSFADYKGKVLLIVNTASKCGFTPQYDGLEALYQKYKDRGLVVIGFPCDQFGHQEPGTDTQIEEFCRKNHGVTFPLMSKTEVNGEHALPLYKWLKSKAGFAGFTPGHPLSKLMNEMLQKSDSAYATKPDIKWNFTKFLISRKGKVVGRYEPTEEPSALEKPIEAQL